MPQKKKGKKKAKKKQAPEEFYRVDLEAPVYGTDQFTYETHKDQYFDLAKAEKESVDLNSMGIGGRIVLMDGSPSGKVIKVWASVRRLTEIEKQVRQIPA